MNEADDIANWRAVQYTEKNLLRAISGLVGA